MKENFDNWINKLVNEKHISIKCKIIYNVKSIKQVFTLKKNVIPKKESIL